MEMAKTRDKMIVLKYEREIKALEMVFKATQNDESLDELVWRKKLNNIMSEMYSITKKNYLEKRDRIATKNRVAGETMCKYWRHSSKTAKSRDTIFALKKAASNTSNGTGDSYEKCLVKIASLAQDYHENLQNETHNIMTEVREGKINKVLNNIKTRMSLVQQGKLGAGISKPKIAKALKKSKNSSAPSLDKIPYEFWKLIDDQFINDSKLSNACGDKREILDILELLNRVYNDIQKFSVCENSTFAEGWMCPLYKKNNRMDIANYRPITCYRL